MKRLPSITFLVMAASIATLSHAEESIREQFESKYQAWKDYVSRPEVMVQSIAGPRFKCQEFREIVKLGLPAIPYIVCKIEENPDEQLLWKAIEEITKVKIRGKYDREKNMVLFPDLPDLEPGQDVYLYWWREGRKHTHERFEKLYSEWNTLAAQGDQKQANEKYQKIKDLGVPALPFIVKKIQEGDSDLVPALAYLTNNDVSSTATMAQIVSWWAENKDKLTLPPVEEPLTPTPRP